jgi:hypothetical protein
VKEQKEARGADPEFKPKKINTTNYLGHESHAFSHAQTLTLILSHAHTLHSTNAQTISFNVVTGGMREKAKENEGRFTMY